ncbi:GNAT family N-acetyltransferase [Phocicoccus schoeneichii]|uniref:GNAT family N-acetyltransferase n=1 Tax=Phocicoccus schoeneichii TaxID=1812261 RepID=UPI003D11797E
MELRLEEVIDKDQKARIARVILEDLPEWFGLPESMKEYVTESKEKPFIVAKVDDEAAGFIVLTETSPDCVEIYVMGVRKKYHRLGIGRKLNEQYEQLARENGYTYSQVKTVATGHYDTYDQTNQFYLTVGYKPLEIFPTLWDEWNPCQVYVKYLGE